MDVGRALRAVVESLPESKSKRKASLVAASVKAGGGSAEDGAVAASVCGWCKGQQERWCMQGWLRRRWVGATGEDVVKSVGADASGLSVHG